MIYVVAVAAIVALLIDNFRLRRLLRSLSEPRVVNVTKTHSHQLLAPGDEFNPSVLDTEGRVQRLGELAGPAGAYVWLFDPSCESCARQSQAVATVAGETRPVILVSRGGMDASMSFIERNRIGGRLVALAQAEKDNRKLSAVPQFVAISSTGVVERVVK